MQRRSLWTLIAGPVYLLVAVAIIAGALLIAPLETDGSYTCTGNALSTIINPEPDDPGIRAVAFDSAAACNHTARSRGLVAASLLGVGVFVSGAWVAARRRSGMHD